MNEMITFNTNLIELCDTLKKNEKHTPHIDLNEIQIDCLNETEVNAFLSLSSLKTNINITCLKIINHNKIITLKQIFHTFNPLSLKKLFLSHGIDIKYATDDDDGSITYCDVEEINDDIFKEEISRFVELQFFDLQDGCKITDVGWECLSLSNTHLTHLHLQKNGFQMTNNGLQHISTKLMNLTHLHLQDCCKININIGLQHICEGLTKLTHLHLNTNHYSIINLDFYKHSEIEPSFCQTYTSNEGLQHLSSLKRLKHLHFCYFWNVTNEGYQYIFDLPKLQTLELHHCTHLHLSSLKLSKLLKHLSLSYCKMTDEGFLCISELSELTKLSLQDCHEVTDVGLCHISKNLKNLTHLEICRCHIVTNVGLKHISNLEELIELRIDLANYKEGHVSVVGLQCLLSSLKKLECLWMENCGRVSEEEWYNILIPLLCRSPSLKTHMIRNCSFESDEYCSSFLNAKLTGKIYKLQNEKMMLVDF